MDPPAFLMPRSLEERTSRVPHADQSPSARCPVAHLAHGQGAVGRHDLEGALP
jgi:hypothetical protein